MTSKITVVSPVLLEILSGENLMSENTDDKFVMVNESFGCPDMSQPWKFRHSCRLKKIKSNWLICISNLVVFLCS